MTQKITRKFLFAAALVAASCPMALAQKPVADMLDVQFQQDGTAKDVSAMGLTVEAIPAGEKGDVSYNNTYKRWECSFDYTTWGGAAKGTVFKADYKNNDSFKNKLTAGHSWECLFKVDYQGEMPNAEAKFFAAHEGGGTGFLICRKANGTGGNAQEITFLPNVSPEDKSNWIWCTSGVVPQPGVYYHIVGVWDRENGYAYIYVNGERKNRVDAIGDLRLPPNPAAQWVGIGCDANTTNGSNACKSNVVIARIYSKVLNQSEVTALYEAATTPTGVEKNLAAGKTSVNFDGNAINVAGDQDITSVAVYSASGAQVAAATPGTKNASINASSYPAGVYIVKVATGNQTTVSKILKK